MIGRDLEQLREMRAQVQTMIGRLEKRKPFQHPRISLSRDEALRHAKQFEGWLDELLFIVEAELYHGPL